MSKEGATAAPKAGGLRVAILSLGVLLLIAGCVLLAAGPTLYRSGSLDLEAATAGTQQNAMYAMAAAGVVGLLGFVLAIMGKKQKAGIVGLLLVVAAGIGAGSLYGQTVMREELPPIYDVQTDWNQPVAFTEKTLHERDVAEAVKVRDDAVIPEGAGPWSGKTFAAAQAEFYDDLKPLMVRANAPEATVAIANAAKKLGWNVMLSDPQGGQVEATYYSQWYGLASDIAVRVTPDAAGSRIDVRSASRIGVPDMGSNASRVKELLNQVALDVR
ncbi:MAG: DUF1499 domain-containing protein [Hyphomonadaceae bacterium]|nr:DUF1499 domain-containing protein [Hyphomonadaceae bacterium]